MTNIQRVWVTKTDFMHFCRCPYAFSAYRTGLIPPTTPDESEGPEKEEHPRRIVRLFKQNGWILTKRDQSFRNVALQIAGRPAGVDHTGGAMVPVVISEYRMAWVQGDFEKQPPKINWRVRWGLAFYWLLLALHRKTIAERPHGRIVIAGPRCEVRDIDLADETAAVEFAITKSREAKVALSPWACGKCNVCQTMDEPWRSRATQLRSLALVPGISVRDGLALERIGITTYDDLIHADAQCIARLRFTDTRRRLEKWKLSAIAIAENHPVLTKAIAWKLDPGNMIVLDTEHGTGCGIGDDPWLWLIGVRVYRHGADTDYLLWAGKPRDERRILKRLRTLLEENADLPIVTWNGTSADFPKLADAAERWRSVGEKVPYGWVEQLKDRHIDLLRIVRDHICLPVRRLGLKEVALYFQLPVKPQRFRVTTMETRVEDLPRRRDPRTGKFPRRIKRIVTKTVKELTIADGREAGNAFFYWGFWRRSHAVSRDDACSIQRALMEYVGQDLTLTGEVARWMTEIVRSSRPQGQQSLMLGGPRQPTR